MSTIEIQDRDIALLRGLFESRLMTLDHIAVLHFDGKREMAKKRVQKLKSAGFLVERPRRSTDPSILSLSNHALTYLDDQGLLSNYPRLNRASFLKRIEASDLTLAHELQVMDVKSALAAAVVKDTRYSIVEFLTWPRLIEFTSRRSVVDPSKSGDVIVKPDGFIRVRGTDANNQTVEDVFFLEVDRGHESQTVLVNKALHYRDFYQRGGLAKRLGAKPELFREYPFRVLFVLHSAVRVANAAKALMAAQPPIRRMVMLSTFDDVVADPLGAVWSQPADLVNDRTESARGTLLE